MSDVLPSVTADALSADLPAHHLGGNDFGRAAVFVPPESFDISVDLGKDKWGVVLEEEVPFLDGPHWDGPATVHP